MAQICPEDTQFQDPPDCQPLASSAEGDKESRDGIHKIFSLFDDDKTGTVWEDGTYFNR